MRRFDSDPRLQPSCPVFVVQMLVLLALFAVVWAHRSPMRSSSGNERQSLSGKLVLGGSPDVDAALASMEWLGSRLNSSDAWIEASSPKR